MSVKSNKNESGQKYKKNIYIQKYTIMYCIDVLYAFCHSIFHDYYWTAAFLVTKNSVPLLRIK